MQDVTERKADGYSTNAVAIRFASVLWVTATCPQCGKRRERNVKLHDAGDGTITCCNVPFSRRGMKIVENRIADIREKFRRKPSVKRQEQIRNEQSDRCLYCFRRFGSVVYIKGEYKGQSQHLRLKLVWDHYVPYIYSLDSSDSNFVASCHICNGFKSDLMMDSLAEYRNYLFKKWQGQYWDTEEEVSWT
jgi:hypothetical protein